MLGSLNLHEQNCSNLPWGGNEKRAVPASLLAQSEQTLGLIEVIHLNSNSIIFLSRQLAVADISQNISKSHILVSKATISKTHFRTHASLMLLLPLRFNFCPLHPAVYGPTLE